MKVYLVGGALRDELLGLPVKERDWVVVGATPEDLLSRGFRPVGRDFPVFLHPKTGEEYALARTERKVAAGYRGFTFYTAPTVTLKEDLKRRDLTINAIARGEEGAIIDYYGGQEDIKAKRLRHISPAFAEDPLRILRVARFSAKLPDFSIDAQTLKFMRRMVHSGEINALVAERVCQELLRALAETNPIRFFETLDLCDALTILLPWLSLKGAGICALRCAVALTSSLPVRLAALMHDRDEQVLYQWMRRYRIPSLFIDLVRLSTRYLQDYRRVLHIDAKQLLHLLKHVDACRRPDRFQQFLSVCRVCVNDQYCTEREVHLKKAVAVIQAIDLVPLQDKQLVGKDFAQALETLQLEALNQMLGSGLSSD